MRSLRMVPLFLGALVCSMAGTGTLVLIPSLSEHFRVSAAVASLMVTFYLVPFSLLQLVSGPIAQLLGQRRSLLAGLGVVTLAAAGCTVAPSMGWLLGFRAVQGVGAAFAMPAMVALLAAQAPGEALPRAMGLHTAVVGLGLSLGPLFGGALAGWLGWSAAFEGFALAAAVALAVVALVPAPPEARSRVRLRRSLEAAAQLWLSMVARPRLRVAAAGGATLAFGIFGIQAYLGPWLRSAQGLKDEVIGVALASSHAASIPAAVLAGFLCNRLGRKRVAQLGTLACAVCLTLLWLLPYSYLLVVGLMAAAGWAAGTASAAFHTIAVDVPASMRSTAASLFNATRTFVFALAPAVLGVAYRTASFEGVLPICVASMVASFVASVAVRLPSSLREEFGEAASP